MFAYFVVSLYCIWRGSVVSLLYEAIYSSVSSARLTRVRESLVLYECLLQIIIVEFPHFVSGVWISHMPQTPLCLPLLCHAPPSPLHSYALLEQAGRQMV